jgi:hypothetical protein
MDNRPAGYRMPAASAPMRKISGGAFIALRCTVKVAFNHALP